MKMQMDNPVAAARSFRMILKNVVEILIGCPLNFVGVSTNKRKKTRFHRDFEEGSPHHKGVFGTIHSFFGCIETQDRGALHFHMILWGSVT